MFGLDELSVFWFMFPCSSELRFEEPLHNPFEAFPDIPFRETDDATTCMLVILYTIWHALAKAGCTVAEYDVSKVNDQVRACMSVLPSAFPGYVYNFSNFTTFVTKTIESAQLITDDTGAVWIACEWNTVYGMNGLTDEDIHDSIATDPLLNIITITGRGRPQPMGILRERQTSSTTTQFELLSVRQYAKTMTSVYACSRSQRKRPKITLRDPQAMQLITPIAAHYYNFTIDLPAINIQELLEENKMNDESVHDLENEHLLITYKREWN